MKTFRTFLAALLLLLGLLSGGAVAQVLDFGGVTSVPSFATSFAAMGDSIVANGCASDGVTNDSYYANGETTWLQQYSLGRLYLPCDQLANYMFAVASTGTSNWLSVQLPQVLATRADWVFIALGREDINANFCAGLLTGPQTVAAEEANLLSIFRQLMLAGKNVLVSPWWPASTAIWTCSAGTQTTQAQELAYQINQWVREVGQQNPPLNPAAGGIADLRHNAYFVVADPGPFIIDPGVISSGVAASWQNCDYTLSGASLHPSNQCAMLIGKVLWDAVKPYIPGGAVWNLHAPDIYDATYNPTGNLLNNGNLKGTGGTVTSPCTGVAAASVTLKRLSGTGTGGVPCYGFKQLIYDAAFPVTGEVQGIWIAPDNSGSLPEEYEVQFQSLTTNFAVGDRLVFGCYVSASASPNLIQVASKVQQSGVTTYVGWGNRMRAASDPPMPIMKWQAWVANSGMVVLTGATTIVSFLDIQVDGTQLNTGLLIRIGGCSLRKVI